MGRSFQCAPLKRLQRINQSAAVSVSTQEEDSKHLFFYLVLFLLVLCITSILQGCWPAWCGLQEGSQSARREWCKPSITNSLISSVILFLAVTLVGVPKENSKMRYLLRQYLFLTCEGRTGTSRSSTDFSLADGAL